MRGVFVVGTDTGVGKTRVACALLAAAGARGRRVAGLKPVSCGTQPGAEGPRHGDALALMAAASVALPYELVNPFAFAPPIAPHLAAAEAGVRLERAAVAGAVRRAARGLDAVVVEGVGGLLVPLGAGWDAADLVVDLGLPAVLVVGLRLGCLNHALLTHEALLRRGVALAGWVGSAIDPGFDRAAGNRAALAERLGGPPLGVLPHAPHATPAEDARALDRLPAALA